MKVTLEINCDGAAFDEDPIGEIRRILSKAPMKVLNQLRRPESLCDAPEASDKLLDINGNTVGFVRVE